MSAHSPSPGSSQVLCVLFADVSGSTRLYETLGDSRALAIVERCLREMDGATRAHGGRTVQTIGDEILATFPSAERAAQGAADMMRRVSGMPPPRPGMALALRIGFLSGPVLERSGYLSEGRYEIHGDTVNTAARVVALARAGQILTNAETLALLPEPWRESSRVLDAFALKGKALEMPIAELFWDQRERTTFIAGGAKTPRPAGRLALVHQQRRYLVDDASRGIAMGREPDNDIVIEDRRVSRRHARIERRRGKFVLVDSSTNGTYVSFEGEAELPVRLEELALHGRGRLFLGESGDEADAAISIDFEVH